MDRERFEKIKQAADVMAGENEWMDFPGDPTGTDGTLFTEMAVDPNFIVCLRAELCGMYDLIEPMVDQLPGRQEVELEAAGLIQSAVKSLLIRLNPLARILLNEPMRTKFRGLMHPMVQAPRNSKVPSIREQTRRQQLGIPPIDIVHPEEPCNK